MKLHNHLYNMLSVKGKARGLESLHRVTYDISTGKYLDRGAVFYPDGQTSLYVNSIARGNSGTIYPMARITDSGYTRPDLVSILSQ